MKFIVYRFEKDQEIDFDNSEAIEAVTWAAEHKPSRSGRYVVTALSRVNVESEPSSIIEIE